MQIAYHIGANCTDEERLLKSLLKNKQAFLDQGIFVPGPGRYRRVLRETIQTLEGKEPQADTREILLDAILDDVATDRLVMSHSAFLCVPARIFENGQFYALATQKIEALCRLFPGDTIELFLALRNPATFLPAAFAEARQPDFLHFMQGVAPQEVRWSQAVARIREAAPEVPLTVWCNEDTPLLWAQLIRELAGVDPMTQISGGFDLLGTIMAPEGLLRLREYLKSHPPQTEVQKRRIIAAFLDKFALEDEIEEELDLPGWTDELVEHLTALYEEDLFEIEKMPGVTFIAP